MVQLTAERPTSRASYVGPRSKAEQQDIQSLVLSCNKDGMESLRKGELKAAFEQLKYAEAIMIANNAEESNDSLLAVTYNNLGCFFKKSGKMHAALSYLRRALKAEVALQTDDVTVAGTHLNICSVLSKLGKHDKAAQHALVALELLSHKLNSHPEGAGHDDYMVLAMAYHNVAVEREYLKDWDHAAMAYKQGHQVALRVLGSEHPLTQTLSANCEKASNVAKKIMREKNAACLNTKYTRVGGSFVATEGSGDGSTRLPDIVPRTGPGAASNTLAPPQAAKPMTADDFNQQKEEELWHMFANMTLGGHTEIESAPAAEAAAGALEVQGSQEQGSDRGSSASEEGDTGLKQTLSRGGPNALGALEDLKDLIPPRTAQLVPISSKKKHKGLGFDFEDSPEVLMEIIDLERDSHRRRCPVRSAQNDNRPNRVIKGSTRTSLVLRRMGMFNEQTNRDEVIAKATDPRPKLRWHSVHVQRVAAERIQRYWRSWHRYCEEHADWMSTTRICATLIQARWRAYHIKRMKLDRAAVNIQRHIRRFLVQFVLRRHTAAVCIQRHVVGVITRRKLEELRKNVVTIQRLVRGGLTRILVRLVKSKLTNTIVCIQRGIRAWIRRRVADGERQRQRHNYLMIAACVNMQRYFRGWKGRQYVLEKLREREIEYKIFLASAKIQAQWRRIKAERRVNALREERVNMMHNAATYVRKLWLAYITRRRYLELKREFLEHEGNIMTIQRHARGFLVRLRLWREAVQAEEELWGAVEIQRSWRGHLGRMRWEYEYGFVWSREMACAQLQRNVRGWMARVRVNRMKRKAARQEFELARSRYRGAQKIQARIRGVLVRMVTIALRKRCIAHVTYIQKMWRGHSIRCRMWTNVVHQKATAVQAMIRGFLTRRRLMKLMAKVIMIQGHWRIWATNAHDRRQANLGHMVKRKMSARMIQGAWRNLIQDGKCRAIRQKEAHALEGGEADADAGARQPEV